MGLKDMLLLMLTDKYLEPVTTRVDSALRIGKYPLKIQITDLVVECANTIHINRFNDSENLESEVEYIESEVEYLVNGIFTFACTPLGFNYRAQIVKGDSDYFFIMYPDV